MTDTIKVSNDCPIILVDTSYFIFYRYYSTLRWYKFKKEDIDYSEIHNDEVFIRVFEKHVLDTFNKLCKKWKTKLSNIILCCDCSRDTIWRHNHVEFYKENRVVNSSFNSHIFSKFYSYIEENIDRLGLSMVLQSNLEADDIVYLMKEKIKSLDYTNKLIIITNDNDYLQLIDENTKIINLANKDISERSIGDPKLDLRIKLIMGDKSDNIQPIHKGIGQKIALKLALLSDKDFEAYLIEKNCKDKYENNRLLVDFSMIPEELIEKFNNSVSIEI